MSWLGWSTLFPGLFVAFRGRLPFRDRQDGRSRASPSRRRAEWFGRLAEWRVMLACHLSGKKILAHRKRLKCGEIDLIVQDRDHLVAIEVKGRARLDPARPLVVRAQQKRIRAALYAWAGKRGLGRMPMRFDEAIVTPMMGLTIRRNAWW